MYSRNTGTSKGKEAPHGYFNPVEDEETKVITGTKRPFSHDDSNIRGIGASSVPPSTAIDIVESGSEDIDESDDSSSDEDSIVNRPVKRRASSSHFVQIFFERFENMTIEEISEPIQKWECPICYAGCGAIRKFKLQSLVSHLKTYLSKRVSKHKRVGKRLEEAIQSKGVLVVPLPQSYKLWNGFENVVDPQIVWPPMVIVVNTQLDKKNNTDKWLGIGNPELLTYFEDYPVVKARQSYGPEGHRGISVLVFEANQKGYYAADSLHFKFVKAGLDRRAWASRRCVFVGGLRQLHGFFATKEDMIDFNKHSQGNNIIKFDVKSYKEMVVDRPNRSLSVPVSHK